MARNVVQTYTEHAVGRVAAQCYLCHRHPAGVWVDDSKRGQFVCEGCADVNVMAASYHSDFMEESRRQARKVTKKEGTKCKNCGENSRLCACERCDCGSGLSYWGCCFLAGISQKRAGRRHITQKRSELLEEALKEFTVKR